MKAKRLLSACLALLLAGALASCGKDSNDDIPATNSEPAVSQETAADAQPEPSEAETEAPQTVHVDLPTESNGTFSNSNLVVEDITVNERKADGSLVKATPMADLKLKKTTVEKNGKPIETYIGKVKAAAQTDVIYFTLTCELNDIAGIALGREYKRTDGSNVLEAKYSDANGDVYPLMIEVIF